MSVRGTGETQNGFVFAHPLPAGASLTDLGVGEAGGQCVGDQKEAVTLRSERGKRACRLVSHPSYSSTWVRHRHTTCVLAS